MRKALLYVVAVFTMALSFEASAQQRVVTGTVISEEDGLGLPGATVLVKGTTVGTTTDLDGNYSLELSRSATVLAFSFTGYITKDINIGNQSRIDVNMEADATELDEIVVVG